MQNVKYGVNPGDDQPIPYEAKNKMSETGINRHASRRNTKIEDGSQLANQARSSLLASRSYGSVLMSNAVVQRR